MSTANLTAASIFDVTGIVAVITGGGTGVGLMMARTLAANGARRVYILGRRLATLQEAAASHPGVIVPIVADVVDKVSLGAAAEQVAKEVGYVNFLAANSGITGPVVGDATPSNTTPAQFRTMVFSWDTSALTDTYAVNVVGVLYAAAAFVELLDAGNRAGNMPGVASSVLVTASISGLLRNVLTGFPYMTSKAGALNLTKSLAGWFAEYGVRVNGLAPGIFPSEMSMELLKRTAPDGVVPKDKIPAERFGNEQDMAGTILYLTSKAGSFVDGNIMVIDGGRLCTVPASY